MHQLHDFDQIQHQIEENIGKLSQAKAANKNATKSATTNNDNHENDEKTIQKCESCLLRLFSRIIFLKLYNESSSSCKPQEQQQTSTCSVTVPPAGNVEQWLQIVDVSTEKAHVCT